MINALIIFIIMYAGMLLLPKWRLYFAMGGAAAMILLGILTPLSAIKAINLNVLMMIVGTMGIVTLFIDSKMPMRLADLILQRSGNACNAIIALCVFSGLISAFVDNVATVLMVAPVGVAVCRKLKTDPVPVIISIAVSSNLQGAATLVGDTTSILLGGYTGMSFVDFIWWKGRPSIFWAVELGALGTVFILKLLFKDQKSPINMQQLTPVEDYFPGILLLSTVLALIIASFYKIPFIDEYKNGIICIVLCIAGIIKCGLKTKSTEPVIRVIKNTDLSTVGMLCGLFIVIEGISEAGIIDRIAGFFTKIGGTNLFVLYTIIVVVSVILSAFIDNIPYVAAMLPVVQKMAMGLGADPTVLYFGLLSGATLGGNITPFGASANVAAIGILQKEGYEVHNRDFFRIGIPFTLTAVLIGYVVIWFCT